MNFKGEYIRLDLENTNCIKAISIIMIVMHNLLHLTTGFSENEFTFNQTFVEKVLHTDLSHMYSMIMSYYGWYGVTCFVFITGYGLTAKYGQADNTQKFSLLKHLRKLIILSVPLILFHIFLDFTSCPKVWGIRRMVSFITFTHNLIYYETLSIEWYIGLCGQLYILWYLCYVRKIINNFYIFIICVIILLYSIFADQQLLLFSRHNFIGWVLPFYFGCFFHRIRIPQFLLQNRVITIAVTLGLFTITSLVKYLWIFGDCLFVFAMILIVKYIRVKALIYIGTMSSIMYIMQKIVRYYFLSIPINYENHAFFASLLFLSLTIISALLWRYLCDVLKLAIKHYK